MVILGMVEVMMMVVLVVVMVMLVKLGSRSSHQPIICNKFPSNLEVGAITIIDTVSEKVNLVLTQ